LQAFSREGLERATDVLRLLRMLSSKLAIYM